MNNNYELIEISDSLIRLNQQLKFKIDRNINIIDNKCNITYNDFYANYLFTNQPCLMKSLTNDWFCQRQWVELNRPNFYYLKQQFGKYFIVLKN